MSLAGEFAYATGCAYFELIKYKVAAVLPFSRFHRLPRFCTVVGNHTLDYNNIAGFMHRTMTWRIILNEC